MADDDHKDGDDIEQNLDEISKKLQIDINVLRDISPEEIQYLLDMCPFLQIVDTVMHYTEEQPPEVQFIEAKSGWKIFDYGDAMCSSPGEGILGFAEYKRLKEGGDEDEGGSGTIWNQAFLTAAEMAEIAKARGWKGIQIIDGHRIMKRGAWIRALDIGLPVVGFEPTADDSRVRARVGMSTSEIEALRHKIKPRRS